MSEWKIAEKDVARCLLLENSCPEIGSFVEEKQHSTVIKKGAVPEVILQRVSKRNKIAFDAIYNHIFFNEKSLDWDSEK